MLFLFLPRTRELSVTVPAHQSPDLLSAAQLNPFGHAASHKSACAPISRSTEHSAAKSIRIAASHSGILAVHQTKEEMGTLSLICEHQQCGVASASPRVELRIAELAWSKPLCLVVRSLRVLREGIAGTARVVISVAASPKTNRDV